MFRGESSCLSWQLCPHMPLRNAYRVTSGMDDGQFVVPKVKLEAFKSEF